MDAPRDWTTPLRIEITLKTMLTTAALLAALWISLRLWPVLLVLVMALFLVGTLDPAVDWLERHRVRRGWGIAFVFLGLAVLTVLVGALTLPALVDQVRALVKRMPEIRERVAELLARSRPTATLAGTLRTFNYDALATWSIRAALAVSARAAEIVAYLASAVFLALYLMIDRDRLRGGVFSLVPRAYHIRLSRVLLKLETIVGGYIRGQLLTSALMGLFTFVLLSACGVDNALAIAVFAGAADVLPYVGPVLSIVPAAAAASSKGWMIVAVVVGLMVAYEELESRFLVPRIYGRALRLPPSVVLFALLAGGTLMGLAGALLALPVASAIRMLVEELRMTLPGEDIDDTVMRARDDRAEDEYERRAGGIPAEKAAAIAVEINEQRRDEEKQAGTDVEPPLTGAGHPESVY